MARRKSIHGDKLGLDDKGHLLGPGGIQITRPCADASITVSAEDTNVRTIIIQLKDINGADIDYAERVEAALFVDSGMLAFATTGGSTGIAIGTDGALLALVAKKRWSLTSEADGDIDLTWTDTGTEPAYLAIFLPNGRAVISSALTNS